MRTGCAITDNMLRCHTHVVPDVSVSDVEASKASRAGGGKPQEGVFDVDVGVDVEAFKGSRAGGGNPRRAC